MNKTKALLKLQEELQEYLEHGYRFHTTFMKEFMELLLASSGHEKEIFNLLVKQLSFIKELKRKVHQADGNEIIKNTIRDYYSIHLSAKNFNFRLLMTFDDNNNPVFLVAFYERAGKRKTDYTQYIKLLDTRYNEM